MAMTLDLRLSNRVHIATGGQLKELLKHRLDAIKVKLDMPCQNNRISNQWRLAQVVQV
jgi:hypothetical protein